MFAVTLVRVPLFGSKLHFANAVCLVSGLLLGPVPGGLAAGIGSGLFDAWSGYDPVQCAITVVSKFLMAYVCGKIAFSADSDARSPVRNGVACVTGAWLYVALYMLKTYVYQRFVYGYPPETVWVAMAGKFPASAINAVTAMVAAPIFYAALRPALSRTGQLQKIHASRSAGI